RRNGGRHGARGRDDTHQAGEGGGVRVDLRRSRAPGACERERLRAVRALPLDRRARHVRRRRALQRRRGLRSAFEDAVLPRVHGQGRRIRRGRSDHRHPEAGALNAGALAARVRLEHKRRMPVGAALRPRHARLAPWAYGVMLANGVFGALSTVAWRGDLELGAGWHFRLAVAIALVLTAAALLSRRIAESERARRLHPALGMAALLLSALQ